MGSTNRIATTAVMLVGLGLTSACATRGRLVPLKGDSTVVALATGQQGDGAQVTVEVEPNAWRGVPRRLTKVTPVLVTIENEHAEPIRIRYNEFALKASDGRVFCALPPFDIKATQTEAIRSFYPMSGFLIAPYQSRFLPGFPAFAGRFAWDPIYFQSNFSTLRRFDLPTGDMLAKALPEGVLQPQGKMRGYLYFENIDPDLEDIEFIAKVVSAKSKQRVAEVRIPFEVW